MELQPARIARLALGLAAALALALAAAGPAAAQVLRSPASQSQAPPFHRLSAYQAIRIAQAAPKVVDEQRAHGPLKPVAYEKGSEQWQVSFFRGNKERAQVLLDDATGAVREAWTGPQVAWRMARGYPGAFAGKLNAPYVWLPLCALFLAPFVSVRRWPAADPPRPRGDARLRGLAHLLQRRRTSRRRCPWPTRSSGTCSRACCGGSARAGGAGR